MAKDEIFNKELVSFKLFGKNITIATPHRLEIVLLFLYTVFFFIADLAQNKFIDLGLEYKVIVISLPDWLGGTISTYALDVWAIALIGFHLALMGLFLMSLRSKETHRVFDIIVGTIAFFGVAILLGGVINQIYSDKLYFLFTTFKSIDFYHYGVYMEAFAGVYWAFTK